MVAEEALLCVSSDEDVADGGAVPLQAKAIRTTHEMVGLHSLGRGTDITGTAAASAKAREDRLAAGSGWVCGEHGGADDHSSCCSWKVSDDACVWQ